MLQLTIPESAWDTCTPKYIRNALDSALNAPNPRRMSVPTPARKRMMSVPAALVMRLERAAKFAQCGDANLIASELLMAYCHGHDEAEVATSVPADNNNAAAASADPERDQIQAAMTNMAWDAVRSGKIAMIEGGTGVGKSRVMGTIAVAMAKEGKTTLIAAPTISVMQHLIDEIRHVDKDVPVAVALGRTQFVATDALGEHLDEHKGRYPDVEHWVAQGGNPVGIGTMKLAEQTGTRICWLYDDLLAVAPHDFPAEIFRIAPEGSGENAQAESIRAMLNAKAEEAPIVVCSYAKLMCAINGWGSPFMQNGWDLLIGDEGHEIADIAASVLSSSLSYLHFKRIVGKDTSRWKAIRAATKITKAQDAMLRFFGLISHAKEGMIEQSIVRGWFPEIKAAKETIMALKSKARSSEDALERRIHRLIEMGKTLDVLLRIGMGEIRDTAILTKSPKRHYPSITIGPRSIHYLMTKLWKRTPAAALFSATFYTRKSSGTWSSRHIARTELAIPEERLLEAPPHVPRWLYSATLMQPCPEQRLAYRYVHSDEPAEMEPWYNAINRAIAFATSTARGGTLILLSSFTDIEQLIDKYRKTCPDRIVFSQSPENSVRKIKDAFTEASAKALRPIWFGTGPAWTGLDLGDKGIEPAKDNILTDLIIPRIPFGLRHSVRDQYRRMAMSIGPDMMDAFFLTRQGIGRLIRRRDLPHRRIWWLDTRIDKGGTYKIYNEYFQLYSQETFRTD